MFNQFGKDADQFFCPRKGCYSCGPAGSIRTKDCIYVVYVWWCCVCVFVVLLLRHGRRKVGHLVARRPYHIELLPLLLRGRCRRYLSAWLPVQLRSETFQLIFRHLSFRREYRLLSPSTALKTRGVESWRRFLDPKFGADFSTSFVCRPDHKLFGAEPSKQTRPMLSSRISIAVAASESKNGKASDNC